jgi:hypothetical protein
MSPSLRIPLAARPFARFVVGPEQDPAHTLDGVFQVDSVLDYLCRSPDTRAPIDDAFEWFNHHLIAPPLLKSTRAGLMACWFRSDAGEMLVRIWELAWLLAEVGLSVRYVWTNHPGPIAYFDEHQIVARRPLPGRRRDCYWDLTLKPRHLLI